MISTGTCAACPVRDRAACAVLTPAERAELAARGSIVELARGETLFAAGDDSDTCATLISGSLKITSFDRDGTERILSLVHPAGFVGELFTAFAHHDVVALTESKLCLFPRGHFESALQRYPALSETLLRRASADLYETRELMALMGRRTAEAKVAGLVLAFARAASDSPCHAAKAFDLPLSRGDMAGLLGLTIETVSRQLTQLEREGLIARRGVRGIELLDPARLGVLVG